MLKCTRMMRLARFSAPASTAAKLWSRSKSPRACCNTFASSGLLCCATGATSRLFFRRWPFASKPRMYLRQEHCWSSRCSCSSCEFVSTYGNELAVSSCKSSESLSMSETESISPLELRRLILLAMPPSAPEPTDSVDALLVLPLDPLCFMAAGGAAVSTPCTGHISETASVVMNGDKKEACVLGIGTPSSHTLRPFQQYHRSWPEP
mmetsp:Transcript_101826/g.311418  ORF Transcript_101826/g.311418 Transcript_101826/m.311418 type:complete len:207 (+) Transcript_101826:495-1115(+)